MVYHDERDCSYGHLSVFATFWKHLFLRHHIFSEDGVYLKVPGDGNIQFSKRCD
jgi:hypothetical protein